MDDYDRLRAALDEHRNHSCPVFAAAALVLPEMKRLMERIAELEAALTPEEIESILDGNAKFLDKRHAECDKIEDENEVLRKRIAELEAALSRANGLLMNTIKA